MPFLTEIVPGLVGTAVENTGDRLKVFSTRLVFVGFFSITASVFLMMGLYQVLVRNTGDYAPWILGGVFSIAGLLCYRFIRR